MRPERCILCGSERLELAFSYDEPPAVETPFELPEGQEYRRDYLRCAECGLYVSSHDLDLSRLYEGDYVDATYGGDMVAAFEKIMSLPPDRSDNVARVERIVGELGSSGRVLDVGSGLAVFPARMKEAGWQVTALDPDPRAAAFAREQVGVGAIAADFFTAEDLGTHDLVTFNKVLEHVQDPVAMLARARDALAPGGAVYVELPDADGAAADPDGKGREEFAIEHLYVFSERSFELLSERADFTAYRVETLREPSGKYTLAGFLRPA